MKAPVVFALAIPLICALIVGADSAVSERKFLDAKQTTSEPYRYEIKKFTVPVDHFSFALNDTFEIRYLVNDTWTRGKNPPIFFYTGNEGNIEMFTQNSGFMWDIAPEFGALLIFAEHRYYGESMPYGNKSFTEPKYLGYLTSQQAMADYIDLIQFIKSTQNLRHSPVIAFGGSYGGMLSAWIRMKYPHTIHGAIAASAPLLSFTGMIDCEAYSRIVTSDFRSANEECPKLIRKSWQTISTVSSTDEGKKWLTDNWALCKPLKNESDVKNLKDWIADAYSTLAMLDYPYPTRFLLPLPAHPISAFCQHLTNSSLDGKDLLKALNKAVTIYANYTGETSCLSIEDPNADMEEGWSYQACTEMVMPMCSDGVEDMFEPTPWNSKEYSDMCYDKYKVRPQTDLACKTYGCRDLSAATNIVLSNGLRDPWSSGGVLKNVSASAIAVVIPEGAHHLDLRGANPDDPYSVVQARNFHVFSIKKWIKQYRDHSVYRTSIHESVIF